MTAVEPSAARTVVSATLASMLGIFPALLLGGFAVMLREDLEFGELQLGLTAALFYVSTSALSIPAGIVSARHGPTRTIVAGLLTTGTGLLGVAVLADSWLILAGFLALAGAGNGFAQFGAHLLIITAIRPQRYGIAFGTLQAAFPLAGIFGGVAIPAIGLTLGWRWAFGFAGLAACVAIVALWSHRLGGPRLRLRPEPMRTKQPIGRSSRTLLAVAAAFGAMAAQSLAVFSIDSASAQGQSPELGAVLLIAGSCLAAAVRIAAGWSADRVAHGSLKLATAVLMIGTLGYAGLALGSTHLLIPAALLAFGGGWGYQGLIWVAIARSNRSAPEPALAVTRLGVTAGSVAGPMAFGAVAQGQGYGLAWACAAVSSVLSVILMQVVRGSRTGQERAP